MSLFGRFFEFIRYPSHSRTIGFLAFIAIVLAIPLTVNIAQKQQEIRQHASEATFDCARGSPANDGNCYDDPATKTGFDGPQTQITQVIQPTSAPQSAGAGFVPTAPLPTLPPLSLPTQTPNPNVQCYVPWSLEINRLNCTSYSGPNNCVLGFQPYLCAGESSTAPGSNTSTSSKPACPGICTGVQTCQNADANGFGVAGKVDTSYSCDASNTICCIIPSSGETTSGGTTDTCTPQGYSCNFRSLSACDANGVVCAIQSGYSCNNGNLCIKITEPTSGGGATGTCPQITAGGNPGAGGNCNAGDPNVNIGTCQSDKCGGGLVPGHTISVCMFNSSANRYCYANDANQCWPEQPCDSGGHPPSSPTNGGSCQAPTHTDCKPAANTCSNTGTWDITVYSGAACSSTLSPNQTCTLSSIASNCNPGNVCPTGGTGTCVASTAPTGLSTITFTIGLDGIGQTGDRAAPDKHPGTTSSKSHNFYYQIFDSAGKTVLAEGSSRLYFDPSSGKFKGDAALTVALTDGTYLAKVRPVGFLSKITSSFQVASQRGTAPQVDVINGDVNADNHLTIDDYTALKGCMFKAATGDCQASDLDDSGIVDIFDYNLWLREFKAANHDGE